MQNFCLLFLFFVRDSFSTVRLVAVGLCAVVFIEKRSIKEKSLQVDEPLPRYESLAGPRMMIDRSNEFKSESVLA